MIGYKKLYQKLFILSIILKLKVIIGDKKMYDFIDRLYKNVLFPIKHCYPGSSSH